MTSLISLSFSLQSVVHPYGIYPLWSSLELKVKLSCSTGNHQYILFAQHRNQTPYYNLPRSLLSIAWLLPNTVTPSFACPLLLQSSHNYLLPVSPNAKPFLFLGTILLSPFAPLTPAPHSSCLSLSLVFWSFHLLREASLTYLYLKWTNHPHFLYLIPYLFPSQLLTTF